VRVGIVGHEGAKFSRVAELAARELIRGLLLERDSIVVSGGCHLGGVDLWAEQEARLMGRKAIIHRPANLRWADGFKPRNLLIAEDSDEIHVIVVREYPPHFRGMRFDLWYHCGKDSHIKSGGCWTAKVAERRGKKAYWHIIEQVNGVSQ